MPKPMHKYILLIVSLFLFALLSSILYTCTEESDLLSNNNGEGNSISLSLLDSSYASLQNIAGAVTIDHPIEGKLPIMIVRNSDTLFSAFSTRCTHNGCPVDPPTANGIIECPCHFAKYTLEGEVISGPAPKRLLAYTVEKRGDSLFISDGDL